MDRDPGYAEAHGLLGFAYIFNTWTGWGDDPRSLIPKAEQAAQRALEVDDNEPWAHLATSALYAYARRNDESIAEIEKVLALNPNLSFAYTWLGAILGYAAKVDEANEALNRAYRISPLDPCNAWIPGLRSISTFTAGRYAEAAELALESLKLRPDMAGFWRHYTICVALMGNTNEAKRGLEETKRLQPTISLEWAEKYVPLVRPKDRERYLEGLRLAGLE